MNRKGVALAIILLFLLALILVPVFAYAETPEERCQRERLVLTTKRGKALGVLLIKRKLKLDNNLLLPIHLIGVSVLTPRFRHQRWSREQTPGCRE